MINFKRLLLLLNQSSVGSEVRDANGGTLGEVQSIGQMVHTVVVRDSIFSIPPTHCGCGEHAISCLQNTYEDRSVARHASRRRMLPVIMAFVLILR